MIANEQTSKVSKYLNLGGLTPRFLQESITLDIINKHSVNEFRKLGLVNRSNINYENKRQIYCVWQLSSTEGYWKWRK